MGVQYQSQGHLLLNGPRERSSWRSLGILRTLDATMTSTAAITTNYGRSGLARRTTVVERSSGEEPLTSGMREGQRPSGEAEPATSRMPPAERSSGEEHAADVDSNLHTAIGAHPPVDRAPTGVLETVDALTEPFHASRAPSAYRASTETGTEAQVPGMNNIAWGHSAQSLLWFNERLKCNTFV